METYCNSANCVKLDLVEPTVEAGTYHGCGDNINRGDICIGVDEVIEGEWVKGTICYCHSDLCNSASIFSYTNLSVVIFVSLFHFLGM